MPKVTKVKASLRSIFYINRSFDPEALDGQDSTTLVTLDHFKLLLTNFCEHLSEACAAPHSIKSDANPACGATQPLDLRWGVETTSIQIQIRVPAIPFGPCLQNSPRAVDITYHESRWKRAADDLAGSKFKNG